MGKIYITRIQTNCLLQYKAQLCIFLPYNTMLFKIMVLLCPCRHRIYFHIGNSLCLHHSSYQICYTKNSLIVMDTVPENLLQAISVSGNVLLKKVKLQCIYYTRGYMRQYMHRRFTFIVL